MTGIIKLTFNPFQENTYIIHNQQNQCWIIDPGNSNSTEDNLLKSAIESNGLTPVELILTHAHVDHIMGNKFVFDTWGLEPMIHKKDMPVLEYAAQAAAMWGIPFTEGPEPSKFMEEGSQLLLGDATFDVIFTPGHSPGEVCLVNHADRYCIAGDVLFYGSIGRTDLPGGNYDTLIDSIQTKLMVLDDDFIVYSGHGPDTTIGDERRNNPFLR